MKPKSGWILVILVAVVCGYFHHSATKAARISAARLGAENAKLAEMYFLKLATEEVSRSFPTSEHGVSASGGVASGPNHFESIKAHDIYLGAPVPIVDMESLIDRLSQLPEIAAWKAAGPELNRQRDCKFVLHHAGTGKPSDRPLIRMLFHESSWPVGQMDPNQLGFWRLNWR